MKKGIDGTLEISNDDYVRRCLWRKIFISLIISFFQLEEYYEPVTKDDNVVSMVTDGTCYFDVEPEEVR